MRPVGLAVDDKGRVFFSSDATGEIYVLVKSGGSANGAGRFNGNLMAAFAVLALYFVVC